MTVTKISVGKHSKLLSALRHATVSATVHTVTGHHEHRIHKLEMLFVASEDACGQLESCTSSRNSDCFLEAAAATDSAPHLLRGSVFAPDTSNVMVLLNLDQ